MPNDMPLSADQPQGLDRILKNLITLALPPLGLGRDAAKLTTEGLESKKDDCIKTLGNFVALEALALKTVFGVLGRRMGGGMAGRLDDYVEKELKGEITAIIQKVVDGVITMAKAQEMILDVAIKVLLKIRNGNGTQP